MGDSQEDARGPIICPLCEYATRDGPDSVYQIMLHMETFHPEGLDSPFVVQDDASIAAVMSLCDEDTQYASCPVEGCGEAILLTELDSHIEMHSAEAEDSEDEHEPSAKRARVEENKDTFDTKLSKALRNLDDLSPPVNNLLSKEPSDSQASTKAAWKNLLKMTDVSPKTKAQSAASTGQRRLGKSELGPHANEKQMPSWLVKILESDGEVTTMNRLAENGKLKRVKVCVNQAVGILPVLRQLLEQDLYTDCAYLCHNSVKHVSKLKKEGGFCGYRNIQMLTSYIIGVKSQGFQNFNEKIPTIFDIQEYIETAWDRGINTHGRIETGGIRGTRKYIGTPDAQAMFCNLGIACDAQAFKSKKKGDRPADDLLFEYVETYFTNGVNDFKPKVRLTSLPPLYFQHSGHSMTIVGIEKKRDGSKNLILFDPMFHDAANIMRLVDTPHFTHKAPADLLRAYRRGTKYLRRYREFEVLKLTPPASQSGRVKEGGWECP